MTFSELKVALDGCSRCRTRSEKRLLGGGKNEKNILFVFYEPVLLDSEAALMSVGEKRLLLDFLSLFDLRESDVYETTLVKCAVRNSTSECEESCIQYLRWQFKLNRPKTVMCFGENVARRLIDPSFELEKMHGKAFPKGGTLFFGTYTLTDALRKEEIKGRLLHDFMSAFSSELEVKFE